MKWFQLDSDAPNDPKIKPVLKQFGQAGAGGLVLLWCYVANHGQGEPGLGIGTNGGPMPLVEMADETWFPSEADLKAFLDFLAGRRHIDPALWAEKGIVFLPAMWNRAVGYARGKGRAGSVYQTAADVVKATLAGEKPPAPAAPENPPAGKRKPGRPRKNPVVPENPPTVQDKQTNKQLPPDGGSGSANHEAGGFLLPEVAPAQPPRPADLMQLWNRLRTKGPKLEGLTPQRIEIFNRALKAKPDLAEWELVIRWFDGQDWANAPGTGEHPNWRCTLDFLCRPGKMQQYLERVKADKAGGGGNGNGRVAPTAGKYDLKDEDDDPTN